MLTRRAPVRRQAIAEAAPLIAAGQPVAVATETVYGLAADATNPDAVARIYAAKGRPSFNPLIVHVPTSQRRERIGDSARRSRALAARALAGPADPRRAASQPAAAIASLVTAGLATIGRPGPGASGDAGAARGDRPAARRASANASGSISPTRAEHVLHSLGGKIPLILDAGPARAGSNRRSSRRPDGRCGCCAPGPIDRRKRRCPPRARSKRPASWPAIMRRPSRFGSTRRAPAADEFLIGFGDDRGRCEPQRDRRPGRGGGAPVRPAPPRRPVRQTAHRGRAHPRRRPWRGDQRPAARERGAALRRSRAALFSRS